MVTRTRNRTMHIIWSAVLSWDYVDDIIRIWDAKKGSNVGFMENIDFHKVSMKVNVIIGEKNVEICHMIKNLVT